MSGLVQFARYISAPIALKYGTSGPRSFSLSSLGRNESLSTSSDLTIIGELRGWAFVYVKVLQDFFSIC